MLLIFFALKSRGIQHYVKYFDTPSFSSSPDSHKETLKKVKKAVDLAVKFMIFNSDCVYYSLAFAMMLRRRNIPAVVCMGVSIFPFRAHAWVQVNGVVVSGDEKIVGGLYSFENACDYE
ncbi:lasso peptide biosynthesis B2 protein [Candidatus Poribacteria bacterium]|nr:lasso peptide biosynthesis B2 protein [Candidatus Poribacteria bacterium]